MLKYTIALSSIAFALSFSPAQAQTAPPVRAAATCTQADLVKIDAEAAKMTDTTKKQAAMKEVKLAKDMLAKNDTKACLTHIDNAAKLMPSNS